MFAAAWPVVVALLAGAAAACARTAAPEGVRPATAPRGHLFIVGGGPQPDSLVREFVDLARVPGGRAHIVVFAMASESGLTGGEEKARDLRALGATAANVHVTRAQAETDSVARLLDDATGIWFGGGDQSRLTAALLGTKTEEAIRRRYQAGAVIGGTSAGAAVMSDVMITGDERRLGGDRPPADSSEAFLTIDRDNIVTARGFGLLPGTIVDQHFVRRKRHNRLVSLVLERPALLGVGVDESTALVVEPGGSWRVTGASVVVVYDARHGTVSRTPSRLGGADVRMHVLTPGSRYDPRTGRAEVR